MLNLLPLAKPINVTFVFSATLIAEYVTAVLVTATGIPSREIFAMISAGNLPDVKRMVFAKFILLIIPYPKILSAATCLLISSMAINCSGHFQTLARQCASRRFFSIFPHFPSSYSFP